MWVLIVVSLVSGGNNVDFQEFTSKQKCENVAKLFSDKAKQNSSFYSDAVCMEK